MKLWQLLFAIAAVAGAASIATFVLGQKADGKPVPVGKVTPVPEGEGWVDLLDAEHAPLWKNVDDDTEIFEIADGMLHIFGVTLSPLRYVGYTGQDVGDFDLHLEYMLTPGANSGVFIRKQPGDDTLRGIEVQVLDDHGQAPTRNTSGSIYDVMTPMFNMSNPAGEWNSYDIAVRGQQVVIYMNGWLVGYVDLSMMKTPLGKFGYAFSDLPLQGMLALQDHGGEVWYRNIRLHPFEQSNANADGEAAAPPAALPAPPKE